MPETPLPRQEPPAVEETLPERLRVHTLARVLGTTSKRVLDALTELDGRSRSAQSSVDQADAIRVREVLAAETETETETEPESRLILETPETLLVTEVPAYMPLFVAPQPVVLPPKAAGSASGEDDVEDSDDDGAGDTGDVEDTDADDRPANRRRRRGRRGRGRGRGE
ncbi:MAG: translation initiation factor IF-2 N-terminal domain-containing protein, partial [Actinomycetota bacterium]|nr:translation initiation factor IF-2 N-terminal domain-containing protein [Actinomycetota bacterium]